MEKVFELTFIESGIEYKKTIEVTEIKYIYGDEAEIQDGILIHETDDIYHDGDCITDAFMPDNSDDLEDIIKNQYFDSCFEIDSDGIYHIG